MVILHAQKLSKSYGSGHTRVKALCEASLEIESGKFYAIMGPSGSGKSTLLNILGFCDEPSSGLVSFRGRYVDYRRDDLLSELRRQGVGYVFQQFNLLSNLSALDNTALPLLLNGVSPRQARTKAKELLLETGLGERIEHLPEELSGGEQQRVAICRAMIHEPSLILADEPTGNLDSHTGEIILKLLSSVVKNEAALIVVTHSETIAQYADQQYSLQDGILQGC